MLQLVTRKVSSCGNACEDPQVAGKVPERRLKLATVAPNCSCSSAGKATLLPQAGGRLPEKILAKRVGEEMERHLSCPSLGGVCLQQAHTGQVKVAAPLMARS